MKKTTNQYLLAAILAFAAVNPVHALSQEEAIEHTFSSLVANPGLSVFSVFTGTVIGITAGCKAAEMADQAGRFVNTQTGLTRNQNFLKKLASIITHAGVNVASIVALWKANGMMHSAIMANDVQYFQYNYPILSAGLAFESLSFGLTLPIAALIKSISYAVQDSDDMDDTVTE